MLLSPILSVVSKRIALSMTFRSSRTFPGHSYFCKASTASLVSAVILPVFSGQMVDEILGQKRNVLPSGGRCERGDSNWADVQAVVDILPEAISLDLLSEIAIARCDYCGI